MFGQTQAVLTVGDWDSERLLLYVADSTGATHPYAALRLEGEAREEAEPRAVPMSDQAGVTFTGELETGLSPSSAGEEPVGEEGDQRHEHDRSNQGGEQQHEHNPK